MENYQAASWLEIILEEARVANWCVRPFCTTCGGMEFRRAYWAAAARQAGVASRLGYHAKGVLGAMPAPDRKKIAQILIDGLRELPPRWCGCDAFRTIMIDLDSGFRSFDGFETLDTLLAGSAAGNALALMRAHAEQVYAERKRREEYESPLAAEERKRAKREERARKHSLRQSESRRKNQERLDLLRALARIPAAHRLLELAINPLLTPEAIPIELIPTEDSELLGVGSPTLEVLLTRIGQRKGRWGRFRQLIEKRLKTELK